MIKNTIKLFLCSFLLIYSSKAEQIQQSKKTINKKSNEEKIAKLEQKIKRTKDRLAMFDKQLLDLKKQNEVDGKVFYDLGSGRGLLPMHAALYDSNNPQHSKKIIESEYADVKSDIPDQERNMIESGKMGSPVYGEIKVESFEKLLNDPDVKLTSCKKAVGIELSPTRHARAVEASKKIIDKNPAIKNKLQYRNENITESNIDDANVIYMGSTCFPDELMEKVVNKLSKLKNGTIIMTLKTLPNFEKHGFEFIKEVSLPMSWSESSPVYIYKINK